MAIMLATRTMRQTPNGDPTDAMADAGAKVEVIKKEDVPGAGSWTQIKLITAPGTPEGWVSSDAVDESGVPTAGPVDKALFAKACWRQALYTGTNAHYLAAVAELESHIRTGVNGDKFAPFNITGVQWKSALQDQDFQLDFPSGAIDNWRMQCAAFAVLTLRQTGSLMTGANKDKRPSAIDLYIAHFSPPIPNDQARADLVTKMRVALEAVRPVILSAGADALIDPSAPTTPTDPSAGQINFAGVPAGREGMAKLIVSKFRNAGYGVIQQIAALANAIAESGLDPNIVNDQGELSVGLFQLNIDGGLGAHHSVAQLKNPDTNIEIIINEARKFSAFKNAASVFDAIDVFVRKVENPANPGTQVQKRNKIAERLKDTQSLLA